MDFECERKMENHCYREMGSNMLLPGTAIANPGVQWEVSVVQIESEKFWDRNTLLGTGN